MNSPYGYEIWSKLKVYINNEYGIAGLMGNLYAESGLYPYRLQGDFTTGYDKSLEYTGKVDNGTYTRSQFISDQKGYGLAQWTYSSRKANLYDYLSLSTSISAFERQIPFLINELQNSYPTVWNTINNSNDLRTISNIVLHQFENPKDQSEAVEIERYNYSLDIYNTYHVGPGPTPPGPTPPGPSYKGIPVWMQWKITRD